ncbi:hypothetical protein EVAR_11820_1 [Eumeta japonica]|uniref:Uncharacterized protein n=1 Tax=Eumeta variegata TaxID=151549 RepID=A0A4C1UQP5_EUMVA|nr:hypothetical protein EVAR_11820_1 [Eumeta japonica]
MRPVAQFRIRPEIGTDNGTGIEIENSLRISIMIESKIARYEESLQRLCGARAARACIMYEGRAPPARCRRTAPMAALSSEMLARVVLISHTVIWNVTRTLYREIGFARMLVRIMSSVVRPRNTSIRFIVARPVYIMDVRKRSRPPPSPRPSPVTPPRA